jgi:CheY-like chemotaxis protein
MSRARVLVVDDEQLNRDIVGEYMTGEGYDLALCEDGQAAWDVLATGEKFDAVILDSMMPRMDGIELLKRIKADANLGGMPVIMQTAAAGHDQVTEGMSLGAYYYLTKPYDKGMLLAIVRAATAAGRRRSELELEGRTYRGIIGMVESSHLRFRTLSEARVLAVTYSSLTPDPATAAVGFLELLVNAIEHGNLGLSCSEKTKLLSNGSYEEEIKRRAALPENAAKWVDVYFQREAASITVRILDQGPGFDWRKYLDLDATRALAPNGRGIALARTLSFDHVEYRGTGSEVVVKAELAR